MKEVTERISFDELFRYIEKVTEGLKDRKKRDEIRKVCDWLLKFDKYREIPDEKDQEFLEEDEKKKFTALMEESEIDNILKSLLKFSEDSLCI